MRIWPLLLGFLSGLVGGFWYGLVEGLGGVLWGFLHCWDFHSAHVIFQYYSKKVYGFDSGIT